jgi:hypothetical protein
MISQRPSIGPRERINAEVLLHALVEKKLLNP